MAGAGLPRRLPVGLSRIVLRPRRRAEARVGAVVHDAQDHGRPARRARAHRQRAGARRAAAPGRLGEVPRRPPHARADAGLAQKRARRHERGARQPLCASPAIPTTCGWRRPSTTRRCSTPLARGEDRLDGLHANTQIPKIIGAAREYELTGNEDLPRHRAVLLAAGGPEALLRLRRRQRRRAFLPARPISRSTSAP